MGGTTVTINGVAKTGGLVAIPVSGLTGPSAIAADSASLYWIDGMSVRKVGLNGGTPTMLASPVYGPPRSIVVDQP